MAAVQDPSLLLDSYSTLKDDLVISVLPIEELQDEDTPQRIAPDAHAIPESVFAPTSHEYDLNSATAIEKSTRRIDVRPLGWETSKETEVLPLTLLGQTMPKIYGLIVEVFRLSDSITVEEQEDIVESLRRGLEKTLQQYPIMVGMMEWDEKSGEIGVRKNRDSAVGFEVRYMDGDTDEFPTFNQLESRHFHVNHLDSEWVFPKFTQGLVPSEGLPTAVFQLTFFRGGCTLGWAVHHQIGDGTSFEQFMTLWADHTRADEQGTASNGERFGLLGSETLPVTPPSAVEETLDIGQSPLAGQPPNSERWEEIKDMFPELTEEPMPALPEDFVFPEIESVMWHFPQERVEQLKAEAMMLVGKDKWISTYDAIMGLLWQSVTRARLPFLKPDLDSNSVLGHMVDIRKKVGIPNSSRFVGIASIPPQCGPLKIRELIKPSNHALVASTIRASINSLTAPYMSAFSEYVANSSDKRRFRFDHRWFFGPDLGATSWLHFQSYRQHDFGFGLPRAIRWPKPLVEYAYIFPTRRGIPGADADEGIEVCVALEKGCTERMLQDNMLRWFAEPRGNEPLEAEESLSKGVGDGLTADILQATLPP